MCGWCNEVSIIPVWAPLHASEPLLSLFNENKAIPQQPANRIQRWAWTLASYEYTIAWCNTTQHAP